MDFLENQTSRLSTFVPHIDPPVEKSGWIHQYPVTQFQRSVMVTGAVVGGIIALLCVDAYGKDALGGIAVVVGYFAFHMFLQSVWGQTQCNICPECDSVQERYNPKQKVCRDCGYRPRDRQASRNAAMAERIAEMDAIAREDKR